MVHEHDAVRAIDWRNGVLDLLDQRKLPHERAVVRCQTAAEVADCIRDMVVRGAPAIGVAAAYGVVLSALAHAGEAQAQEAMRDDMALLAASRPTAVNLFWALGRMGRVVDAGGDDLVARLEAEADAIFAEDLAANRRMGELGAELMAEKGAVLTHCNTGSLATAGFGTALGVVRAAFAAGKLERVYADETRPWLQGSRLTAWELQQDGIPVTLLCEGAAASLMRADKVKWVVVGADRIAANGDTANKIGTYSLAVLARQHGVKFMVVAPSTTLDMSLENGAQIPIEERPTQEVTQLNGQPVAPRGVEAWNPSFDVTPAELIDAIVTEKGVVERPNAERMRALFGKG